MAAVAIPALRGARRAHVVAHAVDAGRVILAFLVMAAGAVWRRYVFIVLHFLDPVVAVNAVQLAVNRLGKPIRRKQRHRLGMAIDHAFIRGISMAIETISAGQFLDRLGCRHTGRGGPAEEHQ